MQCTSTPKLNGIAVHFPKNNDRALELERLEFHRSDRLKLLMSNVEKTLNSNNGSYCLFQPDPSYSLEKLEDSEKNLITVKNREEEKKPQNKNAG